MEHELVLQCLVRKARNRFHFLHSCRAAVHT